MKKLHSLSLLLLCLLQSPTLRAGKELLVIVHSGNPANTLDKATIKSRFLKQNPEWGDGNKVRPADQPGAARVAFVSKVLDMTPKDYERYWLERKYAAAEPPPRKVDDDEAMVKYVGASKGAIGFVDAANFEATKKVKVVLKIAY
ncbi:MAG: hypothetical protein QM756_41515 [Polyangiaceae bacterium]